MEVATSPLLTYPVRGCEYQPYPEPMSTAVTWITMTPAEREEAKREALADLTMTWDELRQEAATHNFRSYEAQQAWMILHEDVAE